MLGRALSKPFYVDFSTSLEVTEEKTFKQETIKQTSNKETNKPQTKKQSNLKQQNKQETLNKKQRNIKAPPTAPTKFGFLIQRLPSFSSPTPPIQVLHW